ncbi:MAG: hypothetical protein R6V47_07800, partial [Candidatus Delongbacteria bacterium]
MVDSKKYIFHSDYRYSINKGCLLVWFEICDFDRHSDKFATKEDIRDLFFKKNISYLDTVSADFYIPHQENTRILSSVKDVHPDLKINRENVRYLKKYIDCALIPFYDFNYFTRSLSGIDNYSFSSSFRYFDKFQNFVRSLVQKKHYIPGFFFGEEDYTFIYYPSLSGGVEKFLRVFVDNLPMISIYGKGTIEDKRSFVSNMLINGLNSFIDHLVEKGEACEYAYKMLRSSSIAHL